MVLDLKLEGNPAVACSTLVRLTHGGLEIFVCLERVTNPLTKPIMIDAMMTTKPTHTATTETKNQRQKLEPPQSC